MLAFVREIPREFAIRSESNDRTFRQWLGMHPQNELRISYSRCQQFPLMVCRHENIGVEIVTIQGSLKGTVAVT